MPNSLPQPQTDEAIKPSYVEGTIEEIFNQMPEIREDWLRLTHFAPKSTAVSIIRDKLAFSYEVQGILSVTTDSFTDNKQIAELIRTKKMGRFERGSFGDSVLIIDIEGMEYKQRSDYSFEGDEVPNANILGFFELTDIPEKYRFTINSEYQPEITELVQKKGVRISRQDQVEVPAPFNIGEDIDEVW